MSKARLLLWLCLCWVRGVCPSWLCVSHVSPVAGSGRIITPLRAVRLYNALMSISKKLWHDSPPLEVLSTLGTHILFFIQSFCIYSFLHTPQYLVWYVYSFVVLYCLFYCRMMHQQTSSALSRRRSSLSTLNLEATYHLFFACIVRRQ